MESQEEKDKKTQALEGKSYLLENEEKESRRKPAENEGSEFIGRKSNESENTNQKETVNYDKANR